MPNPTRTALRRHGTAIVMLSREAKDPLNLLRDFEWFDTDEGSKEFYEEATKRYAEDVVNYGGDVEHAIVVVKNTQSDPLELGEVMCYGTNPDALAAWEAEIKANPEVICTPVQTRASTTPASPKVKPKVKGKAPSTAAAVLKAEAETPPTPKAAGLKARLEAKKADTTPKATTTKSQTAAPKPKPKPTPAAARNALAARAPGF